MSSSPPSSELPTNSLVTPLLTDLYQITMTYAHWKNGRHNEHSVFELFFRKHPFQGQFTIFAGLDEVVKHVQSFQFTPEDIAYLRSTPALNHCDPGFFDYLLQLNCAQTQIHALPQGSLAFPSVPLIVVTGPLAVGQLLETTLLTLVNYPSLLATNAARMVMHAENFHGVRQLDDEALPQQCHKAPKCIEFGLRRAQGPDGGFSASKYAYVGGFAATSNVLAGQKLGLPIAGTHAHAFVQSYLSLDEVQDLKIVDRTTGNTLHLLPMVLEYRYNHNNTSLGSDYAKTNDGELAAFVAYASAFPDAFLCLVDTYDTLHSGLLNFCLVALVLDDLGYTPKGIRLDSGDLAGLSMKCAETFQQVASTQQRPFFHQLDIVASNDINEDTLQALNEQGHAITVYGIGTNLVTCQKQPALGCVYKLVELNGQPRLKLSQSASKVLIPGQKWAYRLWGNDGQPLVDFMTARDEPPPQPGQPVLCRHPFHERQRLLVTPTRVQPLHRLYFPRHHPSTSHDQDERIPPGELGSLADQRATVLEQLQSAASTGILRADHPASYPVMISDYLYQFLHEMWMQQLPIEELK